MKILFDFDNMAGTGSAAARYRIAQAFAKYNAPTASEGQPGGGGRAVEINSTIRRSSGIPYREVLVLMKDGQRVVLRVKAPGDVFQVMVNGRQIAIKNQDDHQAAIREIVDILNAGRAKFQKRMAAVRVPMKRGLAMSSRMQAKQLRAKLIVLDTMIEDAREELASLGVIEATPITEPDPPPAASEPPADPAPPPADAAPSADPESNEGGGEDELQAFLAAIENKEAARLPTSDYFTFNLGGDDAIVTPELIAAAEAKLGKKLVERVLPGLEGQVTLVAEDPEPAADQWLRDVVEGRTKIEGNLKEWRDRIRAAMKDPATVELATAAYKILGAAALAEAQRIIGA